MKYNEILSFNFKLLDQEDSLDFSRKFYSDLGLKNYSTYWALLDINSHKFNSFYSLAKKYLNDKVANFYGYCTLTQSYIDNVDVEWYELVSSHRVHDLISASKFSHLYPEGKIYKFPDTVNVVDSIYYSLFFSQKLQRFIVERNFSGIEFLWLNDTGKYKAKNWFIPVAEIPIGKGLDHDWFDINQLVNIENEIATDEAYRNGFNNFSNRQMKNDIKFTNKNHTLLFELFANSDLFILSTRRYLRQHLPETDFAFGWNRVVGKDRRRSLFINKKVAFELLKENLIKKENLKPIEILDQPPNGIANLDIQAKYPTPLYTKSEFEIVKKYSIQCYEKFLKKEKPALSLKFEDSLKKLKKYLNSNGENHPKGLKKNISNLPAEIIDILKISNGPELDSEVIIMSDQELPEFNLEINNNFENYDLENYETNELFHFAKSINGDWYSINLDQNSNEFNFILRFSHEEQTPIDKWKNFAEFLNDIINGYFD